MDDVIGIVTSSTNRASAFTFYHTINWSTSRTINPGEHLSLWVTYMGWDDVNNKQSNGTLSVGSLVTLNAPDQRPTFTRSETNAMLNMTMMNQPAPIPVNSTAMYSPSSLYIS